MKKVLVIKGDGIGVDVINSTLRVLGETGAPLAFTEDDVGLRVFEKQGVSVSQETLQRARESDAVLFGASTTPLTPLKGYKSAMLTLRQGLDLYANIRPAKSYENTPALFKWLDFVIVRENTEGLYSGIETSEKDRATTTRVITRKASERICRHAFELAKKQGRKKVTAVHKANVLRASDGLFREAFFEVAKAFPSIHAEEVLVDAMAMKMVKNPRELDVIVTTNLFGDILSDLAAQICGGLGLAASANIGEKNALFEPVHGSAPKHAGQNKVNPMAAVLSTAMMLEYLGMEKDALNVRRAVESVLKEGKVLTYDLGGKAKTSQVTQRIIEFLE